LQNQSNQHMLEDGIAEDPEPEYEAAPMPGHHVVAKGPAAGSSALAQVGRPRTKRLAAAAESPPTLPTTSGKKRTDTDAKNAEAERNEATASEASLDDKKQAGAPPTKASLPHACSVEALEVDILGLLVHIRLAPGCFESLHATPARLSCVRSNPTC
jgi:hypothetical protein